MIGKELNQLQAIPSIAPNDLLAIYDSSETLAEKLKKITYEDLTYEVITSVSGLTTVSGHNSLNGIQGGTTDEYYHLTLAEYTELQSGYVTYAEMTTISGDIVSQIPSLTGYATESYVDSQILILSGTITSSDSFLGLEDTPSGYSNTEVLYYTASGIASSPNMTFVEGSGLDIADHMALGNNATIDYGAGYPIVLFINESDSKVGGTIVGEYIVVDNTGAASNSNTTGLFITAASSATQQNNIVGLYSNAANNVSNATINEIVGIRGQGNITAANSTVNSLIAGDFRTYYNNSGTLAKLAAGQFQALWGSSIDGNVTNAYGVLIKATQGHPDSGTNLYGLYIEDQTTAYFDTEYNIYSAGAGKNKFEGNIEFGGTISGTGDIYCSDIYTASGTVHIGDLKLSSSGGTTLLINDSPLSTEPPNPLNVGIDNSEQGIVNIYGGTGFTGSQINLNVGADEYHTDGIRIYLDHDDFYIKALPDFGEYHYLKFDIGNYRWTFDDEVDFISGNVLIGNYTGVKGNLSLRGSSSDDGSQIHMHLPTGWYHPAGPPSPFEEYVIETYQDDFKIGMFDHLAVDEVADFIWYDWSEGKLILDGVTNGVELKHGGDLKLSTVSDGASVNGSLYASIIKNSSGAVELYDNGIQTAATIGGGWEIYNGSERASMSVDSSFFKLVNSDGNVVKISATVSGGEVDMLTADAADGLITYGANTISGTGDIYCNDIYTASGTVHIGDLKLSTSDGSTLLVNDSPISSGGSDLPFPLYPGNPVDPSLGQPGNQSLEINVINGLAVNLSSDGAGGGITSVNAAEFITSVKCWPNNWSSLTYGIDESGDTPPPTFYSDPADAELIFSCSEAGTRLVRIWVNDPSWGYKFTETYVLVQDNDSVCP